jgi:hypothetical protein
VAAHPLDDPNQEIFPSFDLTRPGSMLSSSPFCVTFTSIGTSAFPVLRMPPSLWPEQVELRISQTVLSTSNELNCTVGFPFSGKVTVASFLPSVISRQVVDELSVRTGSRALSSLLTWLVVMVPTQTLRQSGRSIASTKSLANSSMPFCSSSSLSTSSECMVTTLARFTSSTLPTNPTLPPRPATFTMTT